ncbi:MAG: hypothetical protein AAF518_18825 [Spirochaetota bacterium]
MSETETISKKEFPCEKCGGKLEFAPGQERIKCVYCGHEQDIPGVDTDFSASEYDLEEALKNAKTIDSSALADAAHEVRCDGCGAVSVMTEQSDRCPFCGSPVVVENNAESVIVPESLLPFKVEQKEASGIFKGWLKSLWFAPGDIMRRAQQKGMDGIYLPYWTYDANTHTSYSGQRGEYYYTTETYTDSEGNEQTREVRHTEWYNTSGTVKVDFDDILVCASKSLPHDLIDELEPWDLEDLKQYNSAFLSGFVTERYKVDLEEGYGIAKEKMDGPIRESIRRDIGGDEQRINSMNVDYSDTTYKHLLLPLWISSFRYSEKVYRFVINARTGELSGERPWSWIKITLASIAGAGVLGGIFYALKQGGVF